MDDFAPSGRLPPSKPGLDLSACTKGKDTGLKGQRSVAIQKRKDRPVDGKPRFHSDRGALEGTPMTMESLENLYRVVDQEAPGFFDSVVEARGSARNEREFQTRVTHSIERFAKKVGVDLLFREEYTLATGRADAVYNRLVIEYERPGTMRLNLSHGHTRHAVDQVKQYIEDVAKKEKHDRDRLLGVALDGHVMIFARYRGGHWYEEPPLEVNRQSSARLLRSLVSLSSGRALIPENLVEDFGAQNIYSQRVARALLPRPGRAR